MAALREQGITTYSRLLAFIGDEKADPDARSDACWSLSSLAKTVDKRRAVPPLLKALDARNNEKLIRAVTYVLGCLNSRRAVEPLIAIAIDKPGVP